MKGATVLQKELKKEKKAKKKPKKILLQIVTAPLTTNLSHLHPSFFLSLLTQGKNDTVIIIFFANEISVLQDISGLTGSPPLPPHPE